MKQRSKNLKRKQIIKSIDISVDGDMSKEKCESLIRIKSEEEKLEWKSFGMPKTNQEKATFAKTVIAISNTNGGWILLGKDKVGNPNGIIENFLEISDLSNVVNSFVQPEIKNLKVAVFSNFEDKNLKNKNFAIIFVPKSVSLPHITINSSRSIKKNILYVRHSGCSEPAAYHDYLRIIRECLILKQSELLEYLKKSKISKDLEEMKEMLQELVSGKKRIKKKKVKYKEEIEYLFLKDEDFINKIRNRMEENEQ